MRYRPCPFVGARDEQQGAACTCGTQSKDAKGIQATVPENRNLVPAGRFMLFAAYDQGTPSKAARTRECPSGSRRGHPMRRGCRRARRGGCSRC
ncbi:galactose oxidase-like domain-containing protein [Streptomyces sp. NBC_00114]|uniref:galactose oxidase-like domain-containing protein n=1 Tax=Streptomyces sp. NBC_00114 TaxID=2975656 RepID=UPI0038652B0C